MKQQDTYLTVPAVDTTIRLAGLNDLDSCRRIDGTVISEHVWNMQQSSQRIDISLLFSQVRLPRPLEVPYPSARDDLVSRMERGHLMLVAEQDQIVGWVAMSYDDGIDVATVNHLMVLPERRRQGIGTQLMRCAVEGARRLHARVVMTPCLAKSGPAISFLQHLGMEFSGYSEHLYSNHEIALLFAYRL